MNQYKITIAEPGSPTKEFVIKASRVGVAVYRALDRYCYIRNLHEPTKTHKMLEIKTEYLGQLKEQPPVRRVTYDELKSIAEHSSTTSTILP